MANLFLKYAFGKHLNSLILTHKKVQIAKKSDKKFAVLKYTIISKSSNNLMISHHQNCILVPKLYCCQRYILYFLFLTSIKNTFVYIINTQQFFFPD